ncbi:hypothetical protein AYI68_g1418 [Smittium mucronatum]|uniref:Uncharacterized protein n=1 Tax=Smittium mucronatum TaxID=133383 RepID=A0A1R0H5K0_9FUNG|nr:hypothetical protein AYI68_g1418 [Smittium mucronatum]
MMIKDKNFIIKGVLRKVKTFTLVVLILTCVYWAILYFPSHLYFNTKHNLYHGDSSTRIYPSIKFDLKSSNSSNWHLSTHGFNALKIKDESKFVNYVRLPKEYYGPGKLSDLGEEYLVMVPISKVEDIVFLKNFYSDLNIKVICDLDDPREECDHHLPGNYKYGSLDKKTFDLFKYACENFKGYKMYAKMDFDAYLDKNYAYGVIKFMMDNSDKRIYYGNPYMDKKVKKVFMGGNFYAITSPLMADYCSCNIPTPMSVPEDEWYGNVLTDCTKELNDGKNHQIQYMYNDMKKILHKEYRSSGVHLRLGRGVYKSWFF